MSNPYAKYRTGGLFTGGNYHRLLGDMSTVLLDPSMTWSWEAGIMAARAQELVANDPFSAAMVACKLDNTHGPAGLRTKSLAYREKKKTSTTEDRALRDDVEIILDSSRDRSFSADGLFSRRSLLRQLDWMATVLGEGYLIRTLKVRSWASHCTTWRLVRPERVSNPDGRPNDSRLYEGYELDQTGEVVAIHVRTDQVEPFSAKTTSTWQRIVWNNPDGTVNVVRRVGLILPGMLRGVSMFAPLIMLVKQLQGTMEAHVATKRAQACMPIITYTDDPDALKQAEEEGTLLSPYSTFAPLKVFFARTGTQVVLPNVTFSGEDLKAFAVTCYRLLSASWQMPVEVVLCQMGEASLASARAGLDQVDRTAQNWQLDEIEQVEQPIDRCMLAEAIVADQITPGPAGLVGLAAAMYQRPPKYSTDRLKDANAVKQWRMNGRSKTSTLAEYGHDADDEREQDIRDREADAQAEAELRARCPDAAPALTVVPTATPAPAPVATDPPLNDPADDPAATDELTNAPTQAAA